MGRPVRHRFSNGESLLGAEFVRLVLGSLSLAICNVFLTQSGDLQRFAWLDERVFALAIVLLTL
jgi:hypothetical protein